MPFCHLTFWIWSERLSGSIDQQRFDMRAVSGGGRGGHHPQHDFAGYNSYTNTGHRTHKRAGTLPPGYDLVEKPSKYEGAMHGKPISRWRPIQIDEPGRGLVPAEKTPYGRDFTRLPFLIHGPGPKGSDGCIVIDKTHRSGLLQAVEDTMDDAILSVSSGGTDGRLVSPFSAA